MIQDRVKFEVWSVGQQRWRVAYVRPELVHINVERMTAMGYRIRVGT